MEEVAGKKSQEATYARMAPCKNHATKDAKMEDEAEKNAPKISQQKMQGGR
jgi:hypothetical protein